MKTPDPKHIAIKVTDKDKAYFVYFDRESHVLVSVFEYKEIFASSMGAMSPRTKIIVDLAKSRIGMPREETATGEKTSEDHV